MSRYGRKRAFDVKLYFTITLKQSEKKYYNVDISRYVNYSLTLLAF